MDSNKSTNIYQISTKVNELYPKFKTDETSVATVSSKEAEMSKRQNGANAEQTGGESGGGGHVSVDHPTSYGETLMHLLRGNIGAGMFGMGAAFKHGGIILSPILTLFIAIVSVHNQHVLVNCAKRMRRIQEKSVTKGTVVEDPDFAETVELCIANGPPVFRPLSQFSKLLVNLLICITQLGFCCIYIVLINTSISQIFTAYHMEYHFYWELIITLLPIILLSLITDLKYLAPFSMIANICMAAGLALTMYYMFQGLPSITERRYVGELQDLPLYLGATIFSFEGIALVLPLKNIMRKPKLFNRRLGVLNTGMVVVTSLLCSVGFFGYWKYGEEVKGSLTLNLPDSEPLAQVVKIMVATGILITYPLQFFVAIQILWQPILEKRRSMRFPLASQLLFRILLVLMTFTLAKVMPMLEELISLIGALCSTSLAMIFPPILDLVCAFGTNGSATPKQIIKNSLILTFATFASISGTYESVMSLIVAVHKQNEHQS